MNTKLKQVMHLITSAKSRYYEKLRRNKPSEYVDNPNVESFDLMTKVLSEYIDTYINSDKDKDG